MVTVRARDFGHCGHGPVRCARAPVIPPPERGRLGGGRLLVTLKQKRPVPDPPLSGKGKRTAVVSSTASDKRQQLLASAPHAVFADLDSVMFALRVGTL